MHRSGRTISPGKPGRRRRLLWIAAVLVAVLALEWQALLTILGGVLVDSQPPQPADLILVLGGDFWGARVITAAELGYLGYAPVVLISSPPYAGRPAGELALDFMVQRGYPRDMFAIFPHGAPSTIPEALVLADELARRRVKQVLLVTSAYHSRRAAMVFRLFCPGIRFISIPAPDSNYDAQNWWKHEKSRQIFFSELIKIFGTVTIAYPTYLFHRWKSQLWSAQDGGATSQWSGDARPGFSVVRVYE
jgi:uncharacterized SAM-binding protein YcdF (DUF218 family)